MATEAQEYFLVPNFAAFHLSTYIQCKDRAGVSGIMLFVLILLRVLPISHQLQEFKHVKLCGMNIFKEMN
jgi:hypothetical protein